MFCPDSQGGPEKKRNFTTYNKAHQKNIYTSSSVCCIEKIQTALHRGQTVLSFGTLAVHRTIVLQSFLYNPIQVYSLFVTCCQNVAYYQNLRCAYTLYTGLCIANATWLYNLYTKGCLTDNING